jgi:hypothetical protein
MVETSVEGLVNRAASTIDRLQGNGPSRPESKEDATVISTTAERLSPIPAEAVTGSAWPPEQAVLDHLLNAHPRRLDRFTLAAELRAKLESVDVDRALSNLAEAGFVEEAGGSVAPVPKVIAFERNTTKQRTRG